MEHGQDHPQQPSCQCTRIVVAPVAGQAEVVPEYAPRRFRQIGVAVGEEILAPSLAWDDYRSPFMYMEVNERGCKQRPSLRDFTGFRDGYDELITAEISPKSWTSLV